MEKSKSVIKWHEELKQLIINMHAEYEMIQAEIEDIREQYKGKFDKYYPLTKELTERQEEIERQLKHFCYELGDKVYLNMHVGSDIYPYEVVEMKTKNIWVVRRMHVNGDTITSSNHEAFEIRRHQPYKSFKMGCRQWAYPSNKPEYYWDPSF